MVLMTTKEIPYRLNPIGMVSSFARRQVASPFFTDCSVPTNDENFCFQSQDNIHSRLANAPITYT